MQQTLVIQSQRTPLPYPWIARCLASVHDWCVQHGFEYRFLGDELFATLADELLDKTRGQRVIATDLARLRVLQAALREGYGTVVWLDADFLVFEPGAFVLPDSEFAVGREVWVQHDREGRQRVYKKVHNALLMFRQGNPFLDFYADTATRLLALNAGPMSPQYLGPKLLTALHNVVLLPVLETAGMLSPLVCRDIIRGGGPALQAFIEQSPAPIMGANLCASSCDRGELSALEMGQVIDVLYGEQIPNWFARSSGSRPQP